VKKDVRRRSSTHQAVCKFNDNFNSQNAGLILIELLIAVSIGLLLIMMLMKIYLTSLNSSRLETALNTIEDNAKSFTAIMTSEIHQAGNIGCARLTRDFPIISLPKYTFTAANKISGNTSNEIIIRHVEYPNATLTEAMHDNHRIYLSNNIRFHSGDVLVISNCERAEIFIATKVKQKNDMQEITLTSPLHDKYEKLSEVSRLKINHFYIKKTGRRYEDGSDISALYLEDIHHRSTELVAGVEYMQIRYAVKDGALVKEFSSEQISDWGDVMGVAIDFELHAPPIRNIWYLYATVLSSRKISRLCQ
jgi:hypothetical protein